MTWHRTLVAAMVLGTSFMGALPAKADEVVPPAGPNDEWFRGDNATQPNGNLLPRSTSGRDPRRSTDNLPSGYVPDFPSMQVRDWVNANISAAAARAIFRRAENEVAAAYRRAQHRFERSKDLQDALALERDAYTNYLLARQRALQSVMDNPRYHDIIALRDDMAAKLAAGRANHDLGRDEILAMATLKLNYATDARAIEVSALSADPALKEARDRMVAASGRVSTLRANFDESLRENPEIANAHRNLEDARIALITAQAYQNAAATAGGSALDYAYYLHGPTQPRVNYDPSGGLYSPYWVRY